MPFINANLVQNGASLTNQHRSVFWSYGSSDNLEITKGAGYFNDAINVLGNADMIFIAATDGQDIVAISSATGASPVTVDAFITASDISADAIETVHLKDLNVTLAKLSAGITPSHVVKFGGEHTTVGGGTTEDITVTGALATDLAVVSIHTPGASAVSWVAGAADTDKVALTFNVDPSTDHVITFVVYRVAA